MASRVLLFLCLATIIVLDAIPRSDSRNFPLDNCTIEEMDILELYLIKTDDWPELKKNFWCSSFGCRDSELPDEKLKSRVQYTKIIDEFDYHNDDETVNSLSFHSLEENPEPQETKARTGMYVKSKPAPEVMDLKIKFVQRLFSEMRGVRENATHVAIIFVDDTRFSDAEVRNIPQNIQQQNTNIKMFVVIVSERHEKEVIHMNDSLIISYQYDLLIHVLPMAMCKLCSPGWFSFEHDDSVDLLSCYVLWPEFIDQYTCISYKMGAAVSVETQEELHFLQVNLYREIKNIRTRIHYRSNSSQVFTALYRDIGKYAIPFQWLSRRKMSSGPLVVNHWMPGKPAGGRNDQCSVWQFTDIGKDDNNDSDIFQAFSRYKERFNEGWVDVPCDLDKQTLCLCEINLPRRLDDEDMIKIKPANEKSFNQAIEKGDFIKFSENIVSVSSHVAVTDFRQFLKTTKIDFPVFDCGEGDIQYVSYSSVCDYLQQCENNRDETSCLPSNFYIDHNCDSGEALPFTFRRCNGIFDCNDGSDETLCADVCIGEHCSDGSCLQTQRLNDNVTDCIIYKDINDEIEIHNKYLLRNETCALICNDGETCVHLPQLNNGHIDCTGSEGPLDETIGKLEQANTCHNLLGDVIWAPKCVYIKDGYGTVIGCRDMSHLKDCLDYKCVEGYVKCYKSYCIPSHYIGDRESDCPTGEEEEPFNTGSCSGNFNSLDSSCCLHPDLVCNGHCDCPYYEDELNCNVSCLDGFRCIAGTVTVSDYNTSVPLENLDLFDTRTKYLDFSGLDLSKLAIFDVYDHLLNNVVVIKWSNCKIRSFPYISAWTRHMIQTLDISYNLMQNFTGNENMFEALFNIRHLNLSYNKHLVLVKNLRFNSLEIFDLAHTGLSYLEVSFLVGISNLKHLNLSYTFISDFKRNNFLAHFTLQTLDLRGIPIENLYEELFGSLTINQDLYADQYEICCPQIRGTQIPIHTCHGPEDAISSCFDLVGVEVQRILLWIVAVLAGLGNMAVIAYRVIWNRPALKTGYGLFVTNLGISDLIMGVYLFIIAGADYYYRDNYVMYHKSWRESVACKVASFLATLSSESSKLFILLITLDRFLVIKFPFGQIRFSIMSKCIATFLSWSTGFVLALIPTVFMFEIYSSNAMCLGVSLTNQRLKGWEYSSGVFIGLNFVIFLVIAYGQLAIFRAMVHNRIPSSASNTTVSRLAEDIIVAKQLSLVMLSDFICWFPVGLMGLLSLGGHMISNGVYSWTSVLVLPVNSAVNPILYTIPALMAAWTKFRYGHRNPR